jgi:hypothetical protein
VGGSWKMHGRDEEYIENFVRKTLREVTTKRPTRNERIMLEWMLGKQGRKVWIGFIWLRIGRLLQTR